MERDIRRIVSLWKEMRARFGAGGPYLFGEWSVPDAFFTPVATRFRHYQIDLAAYGDDGLAAAYRLLRFGQGGGGWMLTGALLVILSQIPLTGQTVFAPLGPVVDWLVSTPIMAVLRGVLLGTALAALIHSLKSKIPN